MGGAVIALAMTGHRGHRCSSKVRGTHCWCTAAAFGARTRVGGCVALAAIAGADTGQRLLLRLLLLLLLLLLRCLWRASGVWAQGWPQGEASGAQAMCSCTAPHWLAAPPLLQAAAGGGASDRGDRPRHTGGGCSDACSWVPGCCRCCRPPIAALPLPPAPLCSLVVVILLPAPCLRGAALPALPLSPDSAADPSAPPSHPHGPPPLPLLLCCSAS